MMQDQTIGKAFGARVFAQAVRNFDKKTISIVLTCWGAALVVMMLTIYTLGTAAEFRSKVINANIADPALPIVAPKAPDAAEFKDLVDRIQKMYPDISFATGAGQTLAVSSSDGRKYRHWLTALSYIDTVSPQYRWAIKELCVGGKCGNGTLMRAVIKADKIVVSSTSER